MEMRSAGSLERSVSRKSRDTHRSYVTARETARLLWTKVWWVQEYNYLVSKSHVLLICKRPMLFLESVALNRNLAQFII